MKLNKHIKKSKNMEQILLEQTIAHSSARISIQMQKRNRISKIQHPQLGNTGLSM